MNPKCQMPANLIATLAVCDRISRALVPPFPAPVLAVLARVDEIMTPKSGFSPLDAASIAAILTGNYDD